jgi:acetolactate synthase-like protein
MRLPLHPFMPLSPDAVAGLTSVPLSPPPHTRRLPVRSPIVKWSATVACVRDIVPTLRRAFQEAVSGVPGPVFVELPIDVLYPIQEVNATLLAISERTKVRDVAGDPAKMARLWLSDEAVAAGLTAEQYLRAKPRPDTPVFLRKEAGSKARSMPFFVRWYLQAMVAHMFGDSMGPLLTSGADAYKLPAFAPLPVSVRLPSGGALQRTLSRLRDAKRPVLLIGSQAMLFDPTGRTGTGVTSPAALLDAVTALGVPTFCGGMARGLLGASHDLLFRQVRKKALAEADVIILAGTVVDFRLDYGRSLSRKARIVAVNRNAAALDQNTDMFWKPDTRVHADPAAFLLRLAAAAKAAGHAPSYGDWIAALRADEDKKEAANAGKASEPAVGHDEYAGKALLNPLAVLSQVERALPPNAVLVGDGGDWVAGPRRLWHAGRGDGLRPGRQAGHARQGGVAGVGRRVGGVLGRGV